MHKESSIALIICLTIFLAACTTQPIVNFNDQPNTNDNDQPTADTCVENDGACCLGDDLCAMSAPECPQGTQPVFEGCDENCTPIFDCVIDDSDFLIYTNSQPAFQFKYPKGWQVSVETTGVRTSVTLKNLESGYEGAGYLASSLSYMPNQGGVSLSEWEGEIKKSGGWIPVLTTKPIEIGGLAAKNLILPESEAGPRYIFISDDKMTMYDWQFVGVTSEIAQEIISSFAFGK